MKAVKTTNLKKNYGNFEALKDINFEINSGDFFALLGINGAGKTTIIGILTDLVKKTSGKVEVFGIDIDKDFESAKRLIGVVPQEFNFDIFLTVMEIVTTQAGYYGVAKKEREERAEEILKQLDLWDKKESQARELSGGMKRRLMIARALIHKPKLLILDEPTAGVDINLRKSTRDYLKKINKDGTTILLTTHYLEEVNAMCDHIALINAGKIIENCSKKALLAKVENSRYEITFEKEIEIKKCLDSIGAKKVGRKKIEIYINKKNPLNHILEVLGNEDIKIKDIKNTTNELEELFSKLTK